MPSHCGPSAAAWHTRKSPRPRSSSTPLATTLGTPSSLADRSGFGSTPPGVPFTRFVGCFFLAQAAGIASQVPGGLGVVEATLLLLLGDELPKPALAGALLAYRGIYYLAPFGAALGMLSIFEGLRHRVLL